LKVKIKIFLDSLIDIKQVTLLTIVEFIEKKIEQEQILDGIAFPVGVSVNNICAHDTCLNSKDKRVFDLENDLIKIDFGVHIDGIIIDNAFTYTRNKDYELLVNASEEMVNSVIKKIKKDVKITEIQSLAKETLDNFNKQNKTEFVAISSLAGHQIDRYKIHANEKQLIYANNLVSGNSQATIRGEAYYAIEFFVSNGTEQFPQMDTNNITHFMVNYEKLNKFRNARLYDKNYDIIRNVIIDNFKTLAFCQRFILRNTDLSLEIINEVLDYFFQIGLLTKYPAVLDTDTNVRVSQFEQTIYVPNDTDQNVEVLS
jgi:methionyl aminopeptidase